MFQKPIIKGLTISFCCLVCFALLGSLLYTYTPISTYTLPSFSRWLLFLSLLFGATVSSKLAGSKGLFYGLAVSLTSVLILALIGLLFHLPGAFGYQLLPKLLLALIAGIIGGAIGIGLSHN